MNRDFESPETEDLIEGLLADQLDSRGWSRLLVLAQTDPLCLEYVEMHHALMEADTELDLPDAANFAAMRSRVMDEVGLRRGLSVPKLGFGDWLASMFVRPVWAGAMAAALLILVAGTGWWIGRHGGSEILLGGNPSEADLLAAMGDEAQANTGIADIENSPYLFSNVNFSDAGGGRVGLQFDVTRHLRVERAADDPLVKEALAQTLISRSPVGEKLVAIEYAGRIASPKIRQGLLFSMLNDAQLAVRLRAQALLVTYPPDAELQSAFLAVLASEESMQMRLQALDYLAASDLAPERRAGILDNFDPGEDSALLVQAADHGWIP